MHMLVLVLPFVLQSTGMVFTLPLRRLRFTRDAHAKLSLVSACTRRALAREVVTVSKLPLRRLRFTRHAHVKLSFVSACICRAIAWDVAE